MGCVKSFWYVGKFLHMPCGDKRDEVNDLWVPFEAHSRTVKTLIVHKNVFKTLLTLICQINQSKIGQEQF